MGSMEEDGGCINRYYIYEPRIMFYNGEKIILGIHTPCGGVELVRYSETMAVVKGLDGSLYSSCDGTFEDFYKVNLPSGEVVTARESNMSRATYMNLYQILQNKFMEASVNGWSWFSLYC